MGTGRGYGRESGTSGSVKCCTPGIIRPPIQTMLGKTDGGGRKGGKMGGREDIHCMDHNKKN